MKNNKLIVFFILALLAAAFANPLHQDDDKDQNDKTLPIFRLRPPVGSKDRAIQLAKNLYNLSGFTIKNLGSRIVIRSGSHVVEVDTISGGIWTADEATLWNTTLRPKLVENEKACEIFQRLIHAHQLLPELDAHGPFKLKPGKISGGLLSQQFIASGDRQTHQLDTRMSYTITVNLPNRTQIPIVGGGANFQIILGEAGRLIAYFGVWRESQDSIKAEVIPKKEADNIFLDAFKGPKPVNFSSSLAYYSAPSFAAQQYLYPVYVYDGDLVVNGSQVPMRQTILPATRFYPFPEEHKFHEPHRSRNETKPKPNRKRTNTAGTEWIGQSGGLGGSQENALGFVNGLEVEGWNIAFNWGDRNAFKSDWVTNDDFWVDSVDFVFYTGHANGNGWELDGTKSTLNYYDIGASDSDYTNLGWLVVAACGPLEDDLISPGGGNVFTRWGHIFRGLHILLGYGSITFDNTDEGKKLIQYAIEGQTIIGAWLRAATEIQGCQNGEKPPFGPYIWIGAMWATSSGSDPSQDHLFGHGSVAPDPVNPDWLYAYWQHC